MDDQNQILLQTKLHRPRLPKDLVTRWRLMEWLDRGVDHQITLICAPAGFGKTTLISTWLERMAAGHDENATTLPAAWLSLDENDSDLNLFLRYFIAALRTIFIDACAETLALLQARQQPPQAVLYATFSNELEKLPGEAILVLDDYHTISNVEVHNLLTELVRHWPKPLHLVLISRISPPLPLDSLRAKGMLSEIRARDLRFTPQETVTYLSQTQIALLGQNALPLLEERFEGWPAGLKLTALSLRSEGSQESVLLALSSENPNITGYLLDEVLTNQFPAIHSFLLKTSILDRFCASLCEAIVGESDAAWNAHASLDWIERSELFITPLDDCREWYRYHHLFQELLQQRLSAEMSSDQVTNLHRLASAWFEEHGLLDEALHHALAACDLDLAARQMSAGLRDVLNREDWFTLERWLRLLPVEFVEHRPELLMIKAWALQFSWQHEAQIKVLQQVEELMDKGSRETLTVDDLQRLRGQVFALRGQEAYFNNQPIQALNYLQEALTLIPPSWSFLQGAIMVYLGLSMQASGDGKAAERMLLDRYALLSNKADSYSLHILQSLCFYNLNEGLLEQTRQTAYTMLQQAKCAELNILQGWGHYFLGLVHYQWNDLDMAYHHFTEIVDHIFSQQQITARNGVAGLALVHQARGENTKARKVLEALTQSDIERVGSEGVATRSLRARLMLLQGDLEGACRWVDTFTGPPPDQPFMWLEEPQMTRARVLVARGTDTDLRMALQLLDTLDEIADRTYNTRYKIEILALRALALDAQGKTSSAKAAANAELKQAVDLARLGGFLRVFVDLGVPMQEMLHRLAKQGLSEETIRRILAAFPQEDENLDSCESPAQPRRHPSLSISTLAEPLTPRELEVLNLLRGPLSIKEIAQKLNISYSTAKRHTINIYGKLGVNRRWNAVARAEELKILSPI
jgi:LuxR family maltose regulon positive regulatory protein